MNSTTDLNSKLSEIVDTAAGDRKNFRDNLNGYSQKIILAADLTS